MAENRRFDLYGRRALVTGSGRGIGRSIVLGLAEQGADVAIHYAKNHDQAREVVKEAAAFGVQASALQADLAAGRAPQELFEQTVATLGRIDILVLNASVQVRRDWQEISREEFDFQMTVNVRASMELMQLALPGMAERGWGRVLTIGSIQQVKPFPAFLVYSAAKHAQLNMALNLAKQYAAHGVTINNLAPGVIETDRNRQVLTDPEYRQQVMDMIPVGRYGEPDDCAGAALLLCSEAASFITGVDLFVDGGTHLV